MFAGFNVFNLSLYQLQPLANKHCLGCVCVCVCVCMSGYMLCSLCELTNLLLILLDACVQIGHCCPNGGGSEERSGTGKVLWGARKRKHQGICEPPCQQLNDITSNILMLLCVACLLSNVH